MKQYVICPMSDKYLTKDKRYEVLYTYRSGCTCIIDDEGDEIAVNPNGSAHTNGLAWEVVVEEETHE